MSKLKTGRLESRENVKLFQVHLAKEYSYVSYPQMVVMVIFALIVGSVYYQMKKDKNGIQNRLVLIYLLFFKGFKCCAKLVRL